MPRALTLQLGQDVFEALHRLGHIAFEPCKTKFLAKGEKGKDSILNCPLTPSPVSISNALGPEPQHPTTLLTWTALETPYKLEETQASRWISVQPLLSEFTQ